MNQHQHQAIPVLLAESSAMIPQTQWPSATISTAPAETHIPTSFDLLSPVYLIVGPVFFLVVFIIIWLLMVPNPRRPWSCKSHRRSAVIPLRQRGPGDAYEINPEMWRGGGRFVGESVRTRGSGKAERVDGEPRGDDSAMRSAANAQASENGRINVRQDRGPPPYSPRAEQTSRRIDILHGSR